MNLRFSVVVGKIFKHVWLLLGGTSILEVINNNRLIEEDRNKSLNLAVLAVENLFNCQQTYNFANYL